MHNSYVNEIILGFLLGLGFAVAFWIVNKILR